MALKKTTTARIFRTKGKIEPVPHLVENASGICGVFLPITHIQEPHKSRLIRNINHNPRHFVAELVKDLTE